MLKIKRAISFDVLAGCSGFINAMDIALNVYECWKDKKSISNRS